MSELDDAIDTLELRSKGPAVGIAQRSRAELAQLRADLQAAQERIAEQARQVAEARRIFIENIFIPINNCNCQSCVDCRAWLAANPAPLIDDQAAVDRFNDWRREREEDFSRRIEAAS